MHDRLQSVLDEDRLIEDDIGFQPGRHVEQTGDQFADILHHRDGIAVAAGFHDGDVGGFLAVDAHDVVLQLAGVFCLADVADGHPARADRLDRQVVQVFDILNEAVGIDVIVARADPDVSGGQNEVALVDSVDHVHHA